MPPPNMRSISAMVHQTSKFVRSRRNFSSPAGDGKEPKKISTVVARTLACATGLYVGLKMQEPTDEAKELEESVDILVKKVGDISDRICKLEEKTCLK